MKTILITGATSGIGKATYLYLREKGYRCVIIGRDQKKLDELGQNDANTILINFNLLNLDNIGIIFQKIQSLRIKLDGLVHCAGLSPLMLTKENDINVMKETFEVNLFSFIELLKFFQDANVSNINSSIVAISSVAGEFSSYRQTVYGASKAGLEQAVRCMAKELMQQGIRVNCVAPGAVQTEMLTELQTKSNSLKEKLESIYPLGIIPVEKVAEQIEYLLSSKSKYMTGTIMQMDAGYFSWK